MKILHENSGALNEPTVVTIGKFDGFHLGHQRLLATLSEEKQKGFSSCVLSLTDPDKKKKVLFTEREKHKICRSFSIDYLADYKLYEKLRRLTPEQFIKFILKEKLNASVIVVGEDFCFGYQRSGDISFLNALQKKYDYTTICIQKEELDGVPVSSSMIRQNLSSGKIESVNRLLSFPYFITGIIVHGKHLGKKLGFPTINLLPREEKLLPRFGVYKTKVKISGKIYDGMTNVGIRPTIDNNLSPSVETFLFRCEEDLYGKEATILFQSFLREERKFLSKDDLINAMKEDFLILSSHK